MNKINLTNKMTKTYYSKTSYGLLIFLFIIILGLPLLLNNNKNSYTYWILAINSLVFIFILYLFYDTKYTIEDRILKIKSGPFYYQSININTIKSITKTNSIMSAPASSLDRIEIKYEKYNSIIISPKDKKGFINDLMKINPKITHNIEF